MRCYYIYGVDTPGNTQQNVNIIAEDRGIRVKPGYPVDMAHLFHVWFLWGFWDKIFQLSILALALSVCACSAGDKLLLRIVFWAL